MYFWDPDLIQNQPRVTVRQWEWSSDHMAFPVLHTSPHGIWLQENLVLFLSFYFPALGFELRAYTLSHSTSLFCVEYFWDRVSPTICPGWLQTSVLLTPVSWVAGCAHQCLAYFSYEKLWLQDCLDFFLTYLFLLLPSNIHTCAPLFRAHYLQIISLR
jgi:hypothetical protein